MLNTITNMISIYSGILLAGLLLAIQQQLFHVWKSRRSNTLNVGGVDFLIVTTRKWLLDVRFQQNGLN